MTPEGPRVVGLGGGHGLAATLAAVRTFTTNVTAVVSVADDGGSSGRLRRDFDIPAVGDIRRCLVALAEERGPWVDTFESRFLEGDLAGHALGNLVLARLTAVTGSLERAVDEAGRLLRVRGNVLPATVDRAVLVAVAGGRRLVGQTAIEASGEPVSQITVEPPDAVAPARVLEAIEAADLVVLGPGSLYTSVLAAAVPPVVQALAARDGGVVFVCNLKATKETAGYDAADHVAALNAHGVRPDVVLADPDAIEIGELTGPKVVATRLARGNGWAHDRDLLATALRALV